jgi:RNA polymerase sigma-70 factor (ECF subfamily)
MNDPTSPSLLIKASNREAGAWERLLHLYSPLVEHWCRKAGVLDQDLADVSQEIFASVASGLAGYDQTRPGTSFRSWVFGIARHKIVDHFRSGGGLAEGGSAALIRLEQVPDFVDDSDSSGTSAAMRALYGRALDLVRAQFEQATWTAFWKVAIENKSPAEVAAELGTTQVVVRKAKSRILRRIKDELGPLLD